MLSKPSGAPNMKFNKSGYSKIQAIGHFWTLLTSLLYIKMILLPTAQKYHARCIVKGNVTSVSEKSR